MSAGRDTRDMAIGKNCGVPEGIENSGPPMAATPGGILLEKRTMPIGFVGAPSPTKVVYPPKATRRREVDTPFQMLVAIATWLSNDSTVSPEAIAVGRWSLR